MDIQINDRTQNVAPVTLGNVSNITNSATQMQQEHRPQVEIPVQHIGIGANTEAQPIGTTYVEHRETVNNKSDDSDHQKLDDLVDILGQFPEAVVRGRLIVNLLLTSPKYLDIMDDAENDLLEVKTLSGKTANFYAPFRLSKSDEDGANGFLRSPLINTVKFLSSCNAVKYALVGTDTEILSDKIVKKLDTCVSRILWSNIEEQEFLTYLKMDEDFDTDDEDEEESDFEQDFICASDLLDLDSWYSLSFDEDGTANINYTVKVGIHCLELYESEDIFSDVDRICKFVSKTVEKNQATTLSVAFAVTIDNSLIVEGNIRDAIEDLTESGKSKDTEKYPEYEFKTYKQLDTDARIRNGVFESYFDSDEMGSLSTEVWSEDDEFYPGHEDIDRLLSPSQFMFVTVVARSIDSNDTDSVHEEE